MKKRRDFARHLLMFKRRSLRPIFAIYIPFSQTIYVSFLGLYSISMHGLCFWFPVQQYVLLLNESISRTCCLMKLLSAVKLKLNKLLEFGPRIILVAMLSLDRCQSKGDFRAWSTCWVINYNHDLFSLCGITPYDIVWHSFLAKISSSLAVCQWSFQKKKRNCVVLIDHLKYP